MMVLKSYKINPPFFFSDGEYANTAVLIFEKSYFFGLFKREIEYEFQISMLESISNQRKHWDKLIANKTPIKG